jgi:hypothetical protein
MQTFLWQMDFGNEAGDDVEPKDLVSYFVEQHMFFKFVDTTEKVLVATARKGAGKSALIQWIFHKTTEANPDALVIKCRGADLILLPQLTARSLSLSSFPSPSQMFRHRSCTRVGKGRLWYHHHRVQIEGRKQYPRELPKKSSYSQPPLPISNFHYIKYST